VLLYRPGGLKLWRNDEIFEDFFGLQVIEINNGLRIFESSGEIQGLCGKLALA
jgi:hypothetical protein